MDERSNIQFDFVESIGRPAMLEQLAEECTELAHAALKYARYIRGDNPTPMNIEDIEKNYIEEVSDVCLCLDVLQCWDFISYSSEVSNDLLDEVTNKKLNRWKERIEEMNKTKKGN